MAGEMYAVIGETLTDIANAIRSKTGSDDFMTVDSMATMIENIESGGGSTEPTDPVEVYKNTRPSDWLPMPTPNDDEMYLLFHIIDGVSSLLAFTVTCTGNYTVDIGSVSDGEFVQISSTTVTSGSKYEAELFADDYGNLTSTGMKQVMVKVSGNNIRTWAPSTHSKKTSPSSFASWDIVEIACKLPSGVSVACGNNNLNLALKKMRYITWYGNNAVTSMNYMFNNCYSLTTIPQLDTSRVTGMNNMFVNCYSLTTIPPLDTSGVTGMNYMFNGCYSLTTIPQLDTSAVTGMNNMFANCYSLTTIPPLDTSGVTGMNYMFVNCRSLTTIPQLDTSRVTNMGGMFDGCYSLSDITLNKTVTGWAGYAISLKDCSLGYVAIVKFFNSLPTITSAKAITLTGNPGVPELSIGDKAIATGKGWTLTL